MKKIEKEIMQRISSFLPNEHSFSLLEDSSSSWQQPKKKGLSKKGKIGLFAGVPSAALLAAGVATVVILAGSAQKGKPFENGFIKDFSSMKAFGIATSPSNILNNKKQAFPGVPFLEEPHFLLNDSGIDSSDPIHFFAFGADNYYEEATLLNEDGKAIHDYTINYYEEGHDFIFVMIKRGTLPSYYCNYSFSNESNAPFRIQDDYNGYFYDDCYSYVISKRTGKIYDSEAPIINDSFWQREGPTHPNDDVFYREVPTPNFYAYEDGITLAKTIIDADVPYDSLYLGKEEDSTLKIAEILDEETVRAIADYTFASGNLCEHYHWFVDCYGNVFVPGTGAYINGHIEKDVAYDPYINTVYILDQDTKEYYPVREDGSFDLNAKMNDDSFVVYGHECNYMNNYMYLLDESSDGRWHPIYRGKNYLIVNGRVRNKTKSRNDASWEGYYKLTFQEGEDGQRSYEKEQLPVSLAGNVVGQGDDLFFLETDGTDAAHLYRLNCSTLEVESFDIGVGDEGFVVTDWAVEPNGDVFVKGLTSDLSTYEGYIVDGEFTFEQKQRQTKDDHKVYYVRPLN